MKEEKKEQGVVTKHDLIYNLMKQNKKKDVFLCVLLFVYVHVLEISSRVFSKKRETFNFQLSWMKIVLQFSPPLPW